MCGHTANLLLLLLLEIVISNCRLFLSHLDILVFLKVSSFDTELACLRIKVDRFYAHSQGGADPGTTATACRRFRLHLPVRKNACKALWGKLHICFVENAINSSDCQQ